MASQYYLTTPLYYVNDVPHIGHAYTTILADVLARYQRLLNPDRSVYLLTGLDEHGQKVARAAAAAGMEPQRHCDEMARRWKLVWERLGIRYNDFIRTTEPRHVEVVQWILNLLHAEGDIYQREYEGWYSVYEERFFTEKDLIDGKDPIGGRPVEHLKEMNYFFRMSKYQQWLVDHYQSHPDAVLPEFRLNEVLGFLRQPLDDLCISRPKSRLSWGIPIPWDPDYVTYVWFDALTNYYTATVHPQSYEPTHRLTDSPTHQNPVWPADYHLIGKDILTTHAVYWPIMLHAAGLEPPRHILAHGWWLDKSAAKMSKSGGNVVDPLTLSDRYGADAFRYVLMRDMTVGQDAAFSEESFIQRYNSDLANDLGNLYSRIAKLWATFDWNAVPPSGSFRDSVNEVIGDEFGYQAANLKDMVRGEIDHLRPHKAIELIMSVVRGLNRAMEIMQPWNEERRGNPGVAISMQSAVNILYTVTELLEPVMPGKMSELKKWLKPDGETIHPQPGGQLFPRIQEERKTGGKPPGAKKLKSTPPSSPPQAGGESRLEQPQAGGETQALRHSGTQGLADLADFQKLDLRVAKIIGAERAPNADKLLLLQIDVGAGERRQIVAGIGKAYTPEQLVGRRIIVIVNLKPAVIRGHKSEGMLLAAGDDDSLALLSPDRDLPPGARIR